MQPREISAAYAAIMPTTGETMSEANQSEILAVKRRAIVAYLRNPDGPYFAENTNAMVALDVMIGTVGIGNVLYALEHIAVRKSDEFDRKNMRVQRDKWNKLGAAFYRIAKLASK